MLMNYNELYEILKENFEKEGNLNFYFWTESQVDRIPDLLKVLDSSLIIDCQ